MEITDEQLKELDISRENFDITVRDVKKALNMTPEQWIEQRKIYLKMTPEEKDAMVEEVMKETGLTAFLNKLLDKRE